MIEGQHRGWYGPWAVGGAHGRCRPTAKRAKPGRWSRHVGRPSGYAGARLVRIFDAVHTPCVDRAMYGRLHGPRRHLLWVSHGPPWIGAISPGASHGSWECLWIEWCGCAIQRCVWFSILICGSGMLFDVIKSLFSILFGF